ncbi:MAG: multicopper oxidase family protein [Thiolinea sp.]
MLTRRMFLTLPAALSLTGLPLAVCASSNELPRLQALSGKARLAPDDYALTDVWTYGGTVPGTSLRVRQGERLQRVFENKLSEGSAVHWHGIRIDNKMDGVPGLTQKLVEPNAQFIYDFVVPDAGTYWYHSHHRSWEQMARGLYGSLIVEEINPPDVDRDEALLIDDWRLGDDAQITPDFGQMMQMSHAGRTGNWLTVNGIGMDKSELEVEQYERLRLRLVNVANASVFTLRMQGAQGKVVALDGQPLEQPEDMALLTLSPAQRVDVIIDITAAEGDEAGIVLLSRQQKIPLTTFKVMGQKRSKRMPEPEVLPANPLTPLTNIKESSVTELRMEGGAMGSMRSATYKGKEMGVRELVKQGMVWAFNGVAGMTAKPLLTAKRGETVRIKMVNDTGWPHGMHLHGHHFREVIDADKFGPWRDTLLIQRDQSREIAFVADNPGDWLFHCHMLEHQAAGMKTWLNVI